MCCPRELPPSKPCASCGREITWRKKWANCWHHVRYCSARCRRGKPDEGDAALEQAILDLLDQRARNATICPSEAARRADSDGWRDLMEATRNAARRLVAKGAIDIVQGGQVVDPSRARGAIRLRRRHSEN